MDDDGSGVFPEQKLRKFYNEKHQETYANRGYDISKDYIKDTRICRVYSGRKLKATGFVSSRFTIL